MGLFLNDTGSFNGYTLLAPMGSDTTYLIDNCGREINRWASEHRPGLAAYLLPNGDLLRSAQIQSDVFIGGGSGGRLEQFDWDGNLIWEFDYSDSTKHQHHDIEPLPNGNVLILAWEYRTEQEALAQGRFQGTVNNSLWPEQIVEVEKVFPDQAIVVWEWRLWDHLVQDADPNLPNFDAIDQRIERFNINQTGGGIAADWIHGNAIAYNEELDQIALSSRKMNEIYVIDHSTTTAEAASSSGGIYGQGGDFLYRWGNPEMYGRGDSTDQTLHNQHDIQWIPADRPGAGNMLAFSNQHFQGVGSAIIEFTPDETSPGFYDHPGISDPFGPATSEWEYTASGFFSGAVSGCHRQPNGTTLITQGSGGRLFEVKHDGTLVWEYINPVRSLGPMVQGTSPIGNSVFKVRRYAPNYSAFDGRDLTPGSLIELNPLPSDCEIHDTLISVGESDQFGISFANPVAGQLEFTQPFNESADYRITNFIGQSLMAGMLTKGSRTIDVSDLVSGIYLITVVSDHEGQASRRFVKL